MRSSKSNTKKSPPIGYPFRGEEHGGPAASTKLNFSRREKERDKEGNRKVSAAFAKETPPYRDSSELAKQMGKKRWPCSTNDEYPDKQAG